MRENSNVRVAVIVIVCCCVVVESEKVVVLLRASDKIDPAGLNSEDVVVGSDDEVISGDVVIVSWEEPELVGTTRLLTSETPGTVKVPTSGSETTAPVL
jgi:hypothetical protein